MDVFNTFLSKDGRLSRRGYVLCFVLPGALLLGLTVSAFTWAPQILSEPASQAIWLGWFAYLSTMDAQNIRRYHDLGSSAGLYRVLRPFLVILPLIAFALQFLIPAQMASAGDMEALAFLIGQEVAFHMSPVPLGVMAVWFVGILANIAYLAIMPGNDGPNTFGGDPLHGQGLSTGSAQTADPVQRALEDYRANLARPKPITPALSARPAGTFGKKR